MPSLNVKDMTSLNVKLILNNLEMSRPSDEWCCMNCARLNDCLMNEPDLNLLDYCVSYRDVEYEED